MENPFTSKRYVATIDGKADIGIDADKMKIEIKRVDMNDENSEVKSVKVTLPHSEITSFSTDPNTLKNRPRRSKRAICSKNLMIEPAD